jgi:hypothetical protein
MRLVRIQRPEPIRGRRLRQDTSPSSWETRVQIPSAAPICARSKTGQCAGLRIRAVEVRVLPCAPIHQGVGEPGRPCLPWKQKIGGSNPPALTNLMPLAQSVERRSLKADVRGSSPRRAANRPDAALQKRRRRFNSGSGLQAPVARAERHRSSKSADAGSNPVWSSTHAPHQLFANAFIAASRSAS